MSSVSNKKNVLIATGIYPPDPGGPASYVKILERALPRYGMTVKVVTYSDRSRSEIAGSENQPGRQLHLVSRQQGLLSRYAAYFSQVYKLAAWADVIYVQGPLSEGLPACLACLLRRKGFMLKIVGDYAWEQGTARFGVSDLLDEFVKKRYGFKVEVLKIIEKFVAKRAKRIVVPSHYLKRIVEYWGISPEKISVIYNAVGFQQKSANRQQLRQQLGLQGEVLLSVGRLVKWKGFADLIELMPEFLNCQPQAKLVIIGSGPEQKNLEDTIARLGLDGKVMLLGSLPRAEVMGYMQAADIFVLNTAYEGLSHVLLEAMHYGLPIVTTAAGGNTELIADGDNGVLVEFGDRPGLAAALCGLSGDAEAKQSYARRSEAKVDEFSEDRMINCLVALISDN